MARWLVCLLLCVSLPSLGQADHAPGTTPWPTYGGDAGGKRYSEATQINRENVQKLSVAWTFKLPEYATNGALETTPILFKNNLYLTSPMDEVYSLNPQTGQKQWSFVPRIDSSRDLGIVTSRGVAAWTSEPTTTTLSERLCTDRIFLGTLDGRLIALDARTGETCTDFGKSGSVNLSKNVDYRWGDLFSITSPPTVVGDVVIVGSAVEDNRRVDVERGDVRGFDARTGALLWTWQPIPWANKERIRTGAANTWSVIAADPDNGLVFLPTSSPSPDYYGGLRVGNNQDADSLVALDAKTGRKIWAFQVVHHNLWDYDVAAEPLLFTFRGKIPAVAIATKMGLVFVFNRLTGEPLYPIHERPVPKSDVPGEVSSPTQPFPDLPPLSPLTLDLSKPFGATIQDDAACRKLITGLRYDGAYTPVSLRGSLLFPSNIGGVNWGSTALDPATGILYANTNREPYLVRLQRPSHLPRLRSTPPLAVTEREPTLVRLFLALAFFVFVVYCWRYKRVSITSFLLFSFMLSVVYSLSSHNIYRRVFDRLPDQWRTGTARKDFHFGKEFGDDAGAPYTLWREPLQVNGIPCGPQPWGTVSALNLTTGQSAWETALGTKVKGQHTGTLSVGGPIVTAGGLVFTAASQEPLLRAFDSTNGKELWDGVLPVPAQATPMTYMYQKRQYVVVAAGGHAGFGTALGRSVIAYSLPESQ